MGGPKSLKLEGVPALPPAVLARSQFARWQHLWEAETEAARGKAQV